MKQEFVMLAYTYKPAKYLIAGWFMSEKLDGKRAYWDGGISRGLYAMDVPWANTIKDKKPIIATGLWTRAGKVVHAPGWWLDDLPKIPLDGELWLGRGEFQRLTAITARHQADNRWRDVQYKVFDSPINLTDRTITVRDYKFEIKGAQKWASGRVGVTYPSAKWNFEMIQVFLKGRVNGKFVSRVKQVMLPWSSKEAIDRIHTELDTLCICGGEGLMLRKPESFWTPTRSNFLLKYKPWKIGKGTMVGYQHGLGKLKGLMGALILDFQGKRLKISGFNEKERDYCNHSAQSAASQFPGDIAADDVQHHLFPRGKQVKFKYRELSDDGIPKEARYQR